MNEYVNKFIQLSRYALNDVDTDEKKQEQFLYELVYGTQDQLSTHDSLDF